MMKKLNEVFCDFRMESELGLSLAAKMIDGQRRCAFVSAFIDDANDELTNLSFNDCPEEEGGRFLNDEGQVVVVSYVSPFQYEDIILVDERIDNYYQVKKDGFWGLCNLDGEEVVPCRYEGFGWFFGNFHMEGCEKARRNGLWGLVNEQGEEVVPCQYDDVLYFQDGIAPVRRGEFWGYVDESGELVDPFIYKYGILSDCLDLDEYVEDVKEPFRNRAPRNRVFALFERAAKKLNQ